MFKDRDYWLRSPHGGPILLYAPLSICTIFIRVALCVYSFNHKLLARLTEFPLERRVVGVTTSGRRTPYEYDRVGEKRRN